MAIFINRASIPPGQCHKSYALVAKFVCPTFSYAIPPNVPPQYADKLGKSLLPSPKYALIITPARFFSMFGGMDLQKGKCL